MKSLKTDIVRHLLTGDCEGALADLKLMGWDEIIFREQSRLRPSTVSAVKNDVVMDPSGPQFGMPSIHPEKKRAA